MAHGRRARFWREEGRDWVGIKALFSGPNEVHRPVTAADIEEFPIEYQAFKSTCPGGHCIFGGHRMAANAADKVKGALDGVVAKIEKATDTVVANLENITNDTVNKLGRVEDKFGGMFKGVNSQLDELIGGHNGGDPLDK